MNGTTEDLLFSIAIIAKNEVNTLPRLIASLKEFQSRHGEIILVDTGSTDGTPNLARSLGCKVIEAGDRFILNIDYDLADKINKQFVVDDETPIIKPNDKLFDFASARNFSASLAKNDMICTLDSDEAYTVFNLDKINEFIKQGYEQFEYNFIFAHDPFGRPAVEFMQSKFFDRRKVRWEGVVHEVLQGKAKIKFLDESIIKLEHWQMPGSETRSKYLTGLALDCYLHPEKDRQSHYLGRELVWTGRYKSGIKELKRHVAMHAWVQENAQSMIFIGDACGKLNQPTAQVTWYLQAFHTDSTRREALIKLAEFYKFNNNKLAALAYASAALQIPFSPYYANDKRHYTAQPHEIIYWAKGWLGDIIGAQEHLMKAIKYEPFNTKILADTKYYFEYPDSGIDGWMTFEEVTFLYQMAKKMDTVCEVGSWKGRSTHALLSGCKGQVTAVDTFKGSADPNDYTHNLAKQIDVYAEFKKNVGKFKNLKTIVGKGVEVAKTVPDKSFDMVFVDAGHTYEEVKEDIRAWKSKAKILLCGHDYFPTVWMGVCRAVDEELGGPDEVHETIWVKWLNRPKVSICIPTLGRPDKLHRLLDKIKENAGYSNYEVLVGVDDFPPNNKGVPKILKELVEKSTGELVMYLGNDCIPEKDFLQLAVFRMIKEFPDMDGMVSLNDGYWTGEFGTHFLASKKLLTYLQGEFFHTGYFHNGADNELSERCRKIGKYVWAWEARVYHDHPVQTGCQPKDIDEVYKLAFREDRVDHDRKLLQERSKLLGFDLHSNFGAPRVKPNPGVICDLTNRLPKGYQEMKVLNVGIGSGESGVACQLPFFRFKQIDHVEIHWPYIDKARKQIWDSPHGFIQQDIRQFKEFYKYDLVILSDVLEHLEKSESIRIINYIKSEAVKILVFGPLENRLHQHRRGSDDIPSQDHLSLWTEQDFKDLGFKTEVHKDFHEEEGERFDACWAYFYDRGVTKFKEMIENGVNFSFTRLGDGELNCMHGAKGENTDKQTYNPQLGRELEEAYRFFITLGNYYLAGWPLFMSPTDCVPLSSLNADGKVFIHNELLDERKEFYRSLKNSKRKKVFIGPKHLQSVVSFLNADEFIEIPEVNSYSYDFNLKPEKDVIYMICGGMPVKVWMMKLLRQNKDITVIDFGSAFDPIYGWRTRTGQQPTELLREYYKDLLESSFTPLAVESNYIPKTIFTIWLSENNEMPELVKKCIATHEIPGYKHKLITLDNCYHNEYVDAAIKAKQWGKACDYLRIYYLIQEGGIYLDADVEVLENKNFDSLLVNSVFAARENNGFINTAVIGAEKGNQTLQDHLQEVETRFKGDDGLYFESSIEIFTPRIEKTNALILPAEYFYPYDHQKGTINKTRNTITYHYFLKSWKK